MIPVDQLPSRLDYLLSSVDALQKQNPNHSFSTEPLAQNTLLPMVRDLALILKSHIESFEEEPASFRDSISQLVEFNAELIKKELLPIKHQAALLAILYEPMLALGNVTNFPEYREIFQSQMAYVEECARKQKEQRESIDEKEDREFLSHESRYES